MTVDDRARFYFTDAVYFGLRRVDGVWQWLDGTNATGTISGHWADGFPVIDLDRTFVQHNKIKNTDPTTKCKSLCFKPIS